MTTRRLSRRRLVLVLTGTLPITLVVVGAATWRGDAFVLVQAAPYLEPARDLARHSTGPMPIPLRLTDAYCIEDERGMTIAYAFEPTLPLPGGHRVFVAAGPIPTASRVGDNAFAIGSVGADEYAHIRSAGQAGAGCGPWPPR